MERYFYEPAAFDIEVDAFDANGEPDNVTAIEDGYAIFDRKASWLQQMAFCCDVDDAQKIVDALNKADAK